VPLQNIIRGQFCQRCYFKGRKNNTIPRINKSYNLVNPNIDKVLCEPLSSLQEDILLGSLLGDGCLTKPNNSNASLIIGRSLKDKEYLLYEYGVFRNLCTGSCYSEPIIKNNKLGKIYKTCRFNTRNAPILNHYYNQWYSNNIKVIPTNLILNSQIIAIWLADDGHICYENDTHFKLKLTFATNSFTYDEVKFLADQLSSRYNEYFKIQSAKWKDKRLNQYIIEISDGGAITLLRDINDYFPVSMSRKSNIWLDERVDIFNQNRELRPSRLKIKSILDNKLSELKEVGKTFCVSDFVSDQNSLGVSECTVRLWLKKLVKEKVLLSDKIKGPTGDKTQYLFKD
jgi:hypothetical protein